MSDDSSASFHFAPGGCLKFLLKTVALVCVVWALLFGVTWNGKHHGLSCSRQKGVVVQ